MKKIDELKKIIYIDCIKAMRLPLLIDIITYILKGVLSIYTASVLGAFADAVFSLNLAVGTGKIVRLLLVLGVSVLGIPLMEMLSELCMFSGTLKHDRMVLSRFLDKTYEKAMVLNEGEIMQRLEMDPIDLRCELIMVLPKLLTIPVTLLYFLYVVLQISPIFTVVVIAVSFLKLMVPMIIKKVKVKYDEEQRNYKVKATELENEMTKQADAIKLFGLTVALPKRFDQLYQSYFSGVFVKSVRLDVVVNQILAFLDVFCVLIILIVGVILASAGYISVGEVAAMVGYFSVLFSVITDVDYVIRELPIIKNLVERMKIFYMDVETKSGINLENVNLIKAEQLSFSYDNKPILKNVDISVRSGMKIAICGANGSGKSTFLELLSGLRKNYEGKLVLNDVELCDVAIESWRKQFTLVEQDPYLFAGTVKENVVLDNTSASNEEVNAVLNEIGIQYLADRKVTLRQNDLSGGEKQRIAIARALLRNAPYLIMDEPSNNLDQTAVDWICDFIRNSSKTIIYVSHDKALLSLADQMIYL